MGPCVTLGVRGRSLGLCAVTTGKVARGWAPQEPVVGCGEGAQLPDLSGASHPARQGATIPYRAHPSKG